MASMVVNKRIELFGKQQGVFGRKRKQSKNMDKQFDSRKAIAIIASIDNL